MARAITLSEVQSLGVLITVILVSSVGKFFGADMTKAGVA
jgi:hypothetical protein